MYTLVILFNDGIKDYGTEQMSYYEATERARQFNSNPTFIGAVMYPKLVTN